MPQFGTLDVDAKQAELPVVRKLAVDGWGCEGGRALNIVYEFDDTDGLSLFPPALHPSIPLYGNVMVRSYDASPVGPFDMAELRVVTRAGVHQGGFVFGAFASTDAAVEFLRDHYGSPARRGDVSLDVRYYTRIGRVDVEGETVLSVAVEDFEPITAADVLYPVSYHLALVDGKPELVQFEPSYAPEKVERGVAKVDVFDPSAFGEPRIKLTNPLPATYMSGRIDQGVVRYLIDPKQPATAGTRRL